MQDKARAFEAVYEEHLWTVYGYVGYRVNSREVAEDLTQQVFEKAMKAWSRFDSSRASEATWLFAIARNVVIDFYRRRGSEPPGTTTLESASHELPHAEGPEANLGIGEDLEYALSTLTARDREVIALRFGGDLSAPQIAEAMGLTLANVQQILSRSLQRLRVELAGGDDEAAGGSR